MAGRMSMRHAAGYRLFSPSAAEGTGAAISSSAAEEFDESDVWGFGSEPDHRKPAAPASRSGRRRRNEGGDHEMSAAASLPVNVPDWSKILREEYRGHKGWPEESADDEEEVDHVVEGGGVMVPPHELLWRSRAASLSVHEGIGRTLKGRDLRRVRNAIWEKTGFQD